MHRNIGLVNRNMDISGVGRCLILGGPNIFSDIYICVHIV